MIVMIKCCILKMLKCVLKYTQKKTKRYMILKIQYKTNLSEKIIVLISNVVFFSVEQNYHFV